jgi:hypothetical protein
MEYSMNGEMAGRGSRSDLRSRYSTTVDKAKPVQAEVSSWCFTVNPIAGIISVLGVTEMLGRNGRSRTSKASGLAVRRNGSAGGGLRLLRFAAGRGVLAAAVVTVAACRFLSAVLRAGAARPACFFAAMAYSSGDRLSARGRRFEARRHDDSEDCARRCDI